MLPITADSLTQCPHCRAALHTCRQCANFDTARRFECTQDIAERIGRTYGDLRQYDDARRSFGNLFKK